MVVFAIDFGLKRMGLAKLSNNIALPLTPILRKNRNQAARELKEILQKESSDTKDILLIFGCIGSNMDSMKNRELRRRISHFLSLMSFSGKVAFIEEDYTSAEAMHLLQDRKHKTRSEVKKNGLLDSISATLILHRYMRSKHTINPIECSIFIQDTLKASNTKN